MDSMAAIENQCVYDMRILSTWVKAYLDQEFTCTPAQMGLISVQIPLSDARRSFTCLQFQRHAIFGIKIGRDSLVGEYSVIRGQGGVQIGDRVYTSPFTQIIAVNHVFDDPDRPFIEQGITAEGIVIEDDVWLVAGAIIKDGVHVGKGAVVPRGGGHRMFPHTVVGVCLLGRSK
jgi:hypothetical protein